MTQNLHPEDGKGILEMAVQSRRGLKLFGIGGAALIGAGLLYAYLETDAGKSALEKFPDNTEGKKTWWRDIMSQAGIGAAE